jgi:hypothetical protein
MFNVKSIFESLLLIVLTAFAFTPMMAQTSTATLSGTVTDQQDALVAGATVTITNPATGFIRTVETGAGGSFVFALLPPATYRLSVERTGFTPYEVSDVTLNVGDQKSLLVQMKVGQVGATVNVTPDASLVSTSPAVATTIDRQFVANIPLNGRSFQSLITLTPGIVLVPSGITSGQFSVNGQRADANYFTVDGVSANIGNIGVQSMSGSLPGVTTLGTTQSLVSVDAMQEFQVQTSTYSSEYGRQPGGQISIATRSGTSDFHGSIYDYVRNEKFDANNWFNNANGIKRPPERQNDFGGTFSGPILLPRFGEGGRQPGYNGRNRTFFFFSYEGLRLRLPQFLQAAYPSVSLRQTASAAMQPYLNAFPIPNGLDVGEGFAQYTTGYSDPSTIDATSIRIDHTVNQKLSVFGRFNDSPSESAARNRGNLSFLSFTAFETKTLTLGATWAFTSKLINETRVNYSDNGGTLGTRQDTFGGAVPVPRDLLIPSQYDTAGGAATGFVQLNYPGGFAVLGLETRRQSQRQFNLIDTLSLTVGAHQLKFGVDYRRLMPAIEPSAYNLLAYFFTQSAISNSTASFVAVTARKGARPIYTNFSAYIQDNWKLGRRLTVDLGLRWDVNPAPHEANGNDPYTVTGLDNLATMTLAPQGTPLWKTSYTNFAPRLGAAYLVRQTPGRETVLRGGFGVYYDTGNNNGSAGFLDYPFFTFRSVSDTRFPLNPALLAPLPFTISPPHGTLYVFDPKLQLPYTLQWSFGVDQSLGKNQALTVSYVGNAGRRLLQQRELDILDFGINDNFTFLELTSNKATSDYNALQAQFQRRLAKGLQVLASYTWSHALDEDSIDNGSNVPERGNAAFDIRHKFAAAVTYNIPKPGQNRFLNTLFGHWAIDTTIQAQSGPPINITADFRLNPADGSTIRIPANVVPGVPWYINDPSVPGGRRINAAAFSIPAAGQFGNSGRNVVRGFGAWQVDMAVRRQFKLTEKVGLQLRAEAFNVFNHPNFGQIQPSLGASTFGQATNMLGTQLGGLSPLYQIGGPRSLQFAAKIVF